MVAKDFLDNNIPVLKSSDNVDRALQLMADGQTSHLPLVNEGDFEGFLSEEQLLAYDYDTFLSEITPIMVEEILTEYLPILEVIKIFKKANLEILPVFNHQKEFIGVINKNQANQNFIDLLALDDVGGLIEINLHNKEYSLSEISKIIEHESGKITSLFMSNDINGQLQLTLKLDISQISNIISALERYGYDVISYFASEPVSNLEKDRYDLLMKYLSI